MLGGVTTVFDMYYFEDALAEAMVGMNMRAVLAETIVDFANATATSRMADWRSASGLSGNGKAGIR